MIKKYKFKQATFSLIDTVEEIQSFLALRDKEFFKTIAIDIETFSLSVTKAKLATISFTFRDYTTVAFPIDLSSNPKKVRELLKEFFINFKGSLVAHNASYDLTVLLYELFMESDLDNVRGLTNGILKLRNDINIIDTKIITYLLLNSTVRPSYGLKDLTAHIMGDYKLKDIQDLTKHSLEDILSYNAQDTYATMYLYNEAYPDLEKEPKLLKIFHELFTPTLIVNIHSQLVGFPLDEAKAISFEEDITKEFNELNETLQAFPDVKKALLKMRKERVKEKNAKYKKKQITLEELNDKDLAEFNFSSTKHLAFLLYKVMKLPAIETTKKGSPSTSSSTLKELKQFTDDPKVIEFLSNIVSYIEVKKIATSFVKILKEAPKGSKGFKHLIGNFNIGGTVSGRLSSSNPK